MTKTRHTPWLLLTIGCGFLILTGISIYLASQRSSGVTDPEYYSHGLRYNQTLLERKAAASLGWDTDIRLIAHTLHIDLKESSGQPVLGARGELTLLDGSSPMNIVLQQTALGTYQAKLPDSLHGEITADLSFNREGAKLGKRLLLSIP